MEVYWFLPVSANHMKQCILPSPPPDSQTKSTHSCYLYQVILFSAFWPILFWLRLFRGFPPWICVCVWISSFPWLSASVPAGSLMLLGFGGLNVFIYLFYGSIGHFSFITFPRKTASVPQVSAVISTSPVLRVCLCTVSFTHAIGIALVGRIPAELQPQLAPSYYVKKEESVKAHIQKKASRCLMLICKEPPTVLILKSVNVK